jgi:hypothetical protein
VSAISARPVPDSGAEPLARTICLPIQLIHTADSRQNRRNLELACKTYKQLSCSSVPLMSPVSVR